MKQAFLVSDMSCGHCKARIEKALAAWGKASSVLVDLGAKRVEVESAAPAAEIVAVIDEAGYAALPA